MSTPRLRRRICSQLLGKVIRKSAHKLTPAHLVTGWLTSFVVLFVDEFVLPPDHYFFKPSIQVNNNLGDFLWASAPHPQFTGDLQQWVRNTNLDPDWLRVGTDIVVGTTFNGSFSLIGETYPGQ